MAQSLRVLFVLIAAVAMALFPVQANAPDSGVRVGAQSRYVESAARTAYASPPAPGEIIIVPGTTTLSPVLERAVRSAFRKAATTLTLHPYYSVTGSHLNRGWYFISMVGFDAPPDSRQSFSLEDGQAWMGLVLATRNANGTWASAVEGTSGFSALLDKVPARVLSASAKMNMDPSRRRNALPDIYRFPWQDGTSMMYGMKAVHNGGFATVVGQYKAIDVLSDGDVSAGHAPNSLLAAAPGTINYVCDDGTSVAVRIGDLLYVHLMRNPKLAVGNSFAIGEEIGHLRTGWFNSVCGYANQAPNWFHIHWAFPAGATFQAGGWTLDLRDQLWHRGNETRGLYEWLTAESPRWHAEYFSDSTLTTSCGTEDIASAFLFKQWNAGSANCPTQGFSARFSRPVSFPGGEYLFSVEQRGNVTLKIDDSLIIDAGMTTGVTATLALSGVHTVNIEFVTAADHRFQPTEAPLLNVWWYGQGALSTAATSAPASTGWRVEYFGNRDLFGQPVVVQNQDAGINQNWGTRGQGYGLPREDFSVRYTRLAEFTCGRYRFTVHADDGVRIRVGDRVVLDAWREQVGDFQPQIELPDGALPIVVEYYQHSQNAVLSVDWARLAGSPCAGIRRK